jgi:transposase
MVKTGELIAPFVEQMRADLLGGDILRMDETTVQVLKEPGRSPTTQSYIWVQRGGSPKRPILLFTYDPSRSQATAERLLGSFQGYLQTDGYEGYTTPGQRPGIVHVGCFAHARRKFDEALKAQGKHPVPGLAETALGYIRELYRIEKPLREASPAARYQGRQAQAAPMLDKLREWLDQVLPQAPPKSFTGEALGYLHSQWQRLIRYLDDGRLEIDNNLIENAIRPFVIGRNNWLFSDTVGGAMASARLYSAIETAKANGHEPYRYLRYLFQELPRAQTPDDIRRLLPYHLDPAELTPIAP